MVHTRGVEGREGGREGVEEGEREGMKNSLHNGRGLLFSVKVCDSHPRQLLQFINRTHTHNLMVT